MTPNNQLDQYLKSLPPKISRAKSRDICKIGHITKDVLCNWRRGRTRIPDVWQAKISGICGDDIFK